MPALDLEWIRAQFPALAQTPEHHQVVPRRVVEVARQLLVQQVGDVQIDELAPRPLLQRCLQLGDAPARQVFAVAAVVCRVHRGLEHLDAPAVPEDCPFPNNFNCWDHDPVAIGCSCECPDYGPPHPQSDEDCAMVGFFFCTHDLVACCCQVQLG